MYKGEQYLHSHLWLKHLGLINKEGKIQSKIKNFAGEIQTVTYGFQDLHLNLNLPILIKYYLNKI